MERFTIFVSGIFVMMSAWTAPALAIGEDVFVVPRVTVQAQAQSATAAKSIAQMQGRRKAIDILLRRLTVEEDWAYLPTLSAANEPVSYAGDERSAITLTDNDLESLESGFEVYNEKSSPTTYRAFITYRFKPDAVRKLLRDARIPYSEAQTRTALVLPVLETAGGLYLWEQNNPWMAAWKVRPYDNELTPMSAPLGDLEDAGSVTARQALALDEYALSEIARRYSVSQVVVAHAFLQQADGEDKLRIRLINGYKENADIDSGQQFSTAEDAGGDYENAYAQGPSTNDYNVAKVGDILAEVWYSQPSGNFPALAEHSIEGAIAKYAKPWKERTLIDHSASAILSVSAYYRSLSEWAQIRSALISTPLIGYVQVRSLSRIGAEMLIQAYGQPEKLVVAMEAQGLALWSDDGEYWQIATPGAARDRRGRDQRNTRRIFGAADHSDAPYQPASYEEPQSALSATEARY